MRCLALICQAVFFVFFLNLCRLQCKNSCRCNYSGLILLIIVGFNTWKSKQSHGKKCINFGHTVIVKQSSATYITDYCFILFLYQQKPKSQPLCTICSTIQGLWGRSAYVWFIAIQRPMVGMVTAGDFTVASSAFHCEVTVLICVQNWMPCNRKKQNAQNHNLKNK